MQLSTEDLGLLLQKPELLSDEQIANLLKRSEEIQKELYNLWHYFPELLERQQRYRDRKKELAQLTTEKLISMRDGIISIRMRAMADDPDDTNLPDSFFEVPSIDSTQSIVDELLEERQKVAMTPK